jgi:Rrf2 family protein
MRLINRDTDYAARALSYLARHKGVVISVSELAGALQVPRPFLRKILQILQKHGLLVSYKGIGGGCKLVKPASKVHLVELASIFQGPMELSQCVFNLKICPNRDTCVLRTKMLAIEAQVIDNLKAITIGNLNKEK